jgi:hypothetical protein
MQKRCNASRRGTQSAKFCIVRLSDVVERAPTIEEENLRRAGYRAYRCGGPKSMNALFWELCRRGVNVGYCWDGIGGWYK